MIDCRRGIEKACRKASVSKFSRRLSEEKRHSNTEVCLKMKVKRMVKRLFAVGAGVAMLGATAMGAMAADLSTYPDFLVDSATGTFNGSVVIGSNALGADTAGAIDITGSMKYAAAAAGTSTSVSGDAWMVKAGSDVLEFGENIGPSTGGVVDFLDDSDLGALESGSLSNSKGTFNYEQFLHFDRGVINTTYAKDDEDKTALFMKIKDDLQFARYELNFLEAAKSDIDASESYKLDDFQDKQITMFGNTYNIVKAVSGGANSNRVVLTLMAGSTSASLEEGGAPGEYTIDGKTYKVELTFTDSSDRARFSVNGKTTPLLDEGDTETLDDGTVLGLTGVDYQDYAGGIHKATFFLGANKIVLEDDDVTVASSTDELTVNEETIDGADIIISGSITDNATSATEDGELQLDYIWVNMTSQDDYFIAAGETLSEQPELAEKGLLFSGNWDIQFEGADASVETDEIKVQDKSGEKEYDLTFTNVKGDIITLPFAYANASATVRLGDQNDALTLNNSRIADDQYFILNDDTDEDSVTHVVQFKGTDDIGNSNPQAKFKILATGETVSRPITFGTGVNGATGTLKLSGTTYTFTNVSNSVTTYQMVGGNATHAVSSKNWDIAVTGGSATYAQSLSNVNILQSNYLITNGGARVNLHTLMNQSAPNAGTVYYNVTLIDSNGVDDQAGTVSNTAPYLVFGSNLTAASSELDFSAVIGITLTAPDNDNDNTYGYSTNGAWVHRSSPSGSTSADTVTIDWPQEERTMLAYVTSGATTTVKKAGGNMQLVQVDSTKLDADVTDVAAENLLVVGGPCANSVAAKLMGNNADCTAGFELGKGRIKLFTNGDKVAMLVAGYSADDTRCAAKVVMHRSAELTGDDLVVSCTNLAYNAASISQAVQAVE